MWTNISECLVSIIILSAQSLHVSFVFVIHATDSVPSLGVNLNNGDNYRLENTTRVIEVKNESDDITFICSLDAFQDELICTTEAQCELFKIHGNGFQIAAGDLSTRCGNQAMHSFAEPVAKDEPFSVAEVRGLTEIRS